MVKCQRTRSLYNLINTAVEQTTIATSVPGVIDQFVKLCGVTSSEVYPLLFWDNAIIKKTFLNIDSYCPTKHKIDTFKTFIKCKLFKKLTPPKFNHKNQTINDKNALKSTLHKLRYCKMIFLLSQNEDNRHELLSETTVSVNKTESDELDDSDTDISYETTEPPLILHILFDMLNNALNYFSDILNSNNYRLTCIDDESKHNNDMKMEIEIDYSSKLIIKQLQLIKWCFCAIFMLSWSMQSRMEITDYKNTIIIKQMLKYFVILKYLINHNCDYNNYIFIQHIDHIRSIFLLLKQLCKTIPFPQNIYGGHNGAILLIAEILIYCKSITLKLNDKTFKNINENELDIIKNNLLNVYFHGIYLLEFLNKKCDLIKLHLQRYQNTKNQLLHICLNRATCKSLCFGFRKYYLLFCKKCGTDLFRLNENIIEENGINVFIPNNVSITQYKNYYYIALKKFCKQKEFKQFDNDNMFNIIIEYLNYECYVEQVIDFKDEIGNWCEFKVKEIDDRICYKHRMKIGADFGKKWDQWIDSRSIRIDHHMMHTKISAVTRDDML